MDGSIANPYAQPTPTMPRGHFAHLITSIIIIVAGVVVVAWIVAECETGGAEPTIMVAMVAIVIHPAHARVAAEAHIIAAGAS
jgi:hypothetical protein